MKRYGSLGSTIITLAALIFLFTLPAHGGTLDKDRSIGENFVGEELKFTIGFWIFNGIAESSFGMERDGDEYVATLRAATTGFLRGFTSRNDTYIARIKEIDGGRRFRTVSFEEQVVVGDKVRRKVVVLDYENRLVRWSKWKKGKVTSEGTIEMEEGKVYEDPLCAFYNFRYGAYGPAEYGSEYFINSIPKGKGRPFDISLNIPVESEQVKRAEARRVLPIVQDMQGEKYFVDVRVDKDLFDSSSGDIELLFDDELTPVWILAKDVLLFGDVRGRLIDSRRADFLVTDLGVN